MSVTECVPKVQTGGLTADSVDPHQTAPSVGCPWSTVFVLELSKC